ncbi:MAG: hypothetical protein QXO21_02405 [Candidatus Anstonellales archaeon]
MRRVTVSSKYKYLKFAFLFIALILLFFSACLDLLDAFKSPKQKLVEYVEANKKIEGSFIYNIKFSQEAIKLILRDAKLFFAIKDKNFKLGFSFSALGMNMHAAAYNKKDKIIICTEYSGSFLGLTEQKTQIDCSLSKNEDSIGYLKTIDLDNLNFDGIDVTFAEPKERVINNYLSECFNLNLSEKVINLTVPSIDEFKSIGTTDSMYGSTTYTNKKDKNAERFYNTLLCFSKEKKFITLLNLTPYEKSTIIGDYIKGDSLELIIESYNEKISEKDFELPVKVSLQDAKCDDGVIKLSTLLLDDKINQIQIIVYNNSYDYFYDLDKSKYTYKDKREKIYSDYYYLTSPFEEKIILIDLKDECVSGSFEVCTDDKNCKYVYCWKSNKCYYYGNNYNYNYDYNYNYGNSWNIYKNTKIDLLSIVGQAKKVQNINYSLNSLIISIKAKEQINLKDLKVNLSFYDTKHNYVTYALNYSGSRNAYDNLYGVIIKTDPSKKFSYQNPVVDKAALVELNVSLNNLKNSYGNDIKNLTLYIDFVVNKTNDYGIGIYLPKEIDRETIVIYQ